MRILIFTISLCLSLLLNILSFGQKIYIDENIGYWYNINHDLHVNHNIFDDGDTIHVFMEITFINDKDFDDYSYAYEMHDSYHTKDVKESDSINIQDHIVGLRSEKVFLKFAIETNAKADLVIFKAIDKKTGIDYAYDIPLIDDYNFSSDGLVLYDGQGTNPVLQSFIADDQSVMIKSINPYNNPVFCFYYSHDFDPALPPMITDKKQPGKALSIDSVFTIDIGEAMNLTKKGLYFFQKDSSSAKGIAVRVQDKFFPLVKTFEEILPPLMYISTRSETDAIRLATDQQKAFEDYWIKMVKVPNLASATVNTYYERVEAANYLFTSFEEGWKSDMGLIFIIYGPPNDVYKSEEIIDWVYNQDLTMPNIRFSFYKVKNVFTDHHYTLLRKKSYDKNWFKSVEQWRDGKK